MAGSTTFRTDALSSAQLLSSYTDGGRIRMPNSKKQSRLAVVHDLAGPGDIARDLVVTPCGANCGLAQGD